MAELILDGATRSVDLSSFSPARLAAPIQTVRPSRAGVLADKPITPQRTRWATVIVVAVSGLSVATRGWTNGDRSHSGALHARALLTPRSSR